MSACTPGDEPDQNEICDDGDRNETGQLRGDHM